MDSNPICHPSPAKKNEMLIFRLCSLLMISLAGRWTQTPSATSLQPKNEMLIFGLHSTSDDRPGWSMDSNPICHPSPDKKWNAHFLDYIQLLIISRAGWWTQTPSATPLQPKKWKAHFWIMFNFWCWPGWLMDSNPIRPPSPIKNMKCSFLDYVQLLMIGRAGLWTQTPSAIPLQPKKMKCSFLDYVHFWWSAWLVNGLKAHPSPLFSQKNEMLIFRLHSLLMISLAGRWTQTPSATPLQPKKWNAHFWITFNFWWSAGLVNGLESHLPSLSSQKMKCSFLDYIQLLIISWAGWWTQTPSSTPLQPKKWNAQFWIMFNFWCWLGWLMDSNPICHPSPAKKLNACFWIMFNFWWSAGLVNGLEPHLPPLSSQKNEKLIFGLHSMLAWLVDGLEPHLTPLSNLKNEMLVFWIMFHFWWLAGLVYGLKPHLPPLSSQKKWNAHF